MSNFDEWFESNDIRLICKKDAASFIYEKAWNEQQKKIDRALEFTENVHDENWQDAITCIKELLK